MYIAGNHRLRMPAGRLSGGSARELVGIHATAIANLFTIENFNSEITT